MGDVRKVWCEDNVVKLLQFTDGNGAIIVDYLRSLREVQSAAARKVFPPEEVREKVISDYRATLKSEGQGYLRDPKVPHYHGGVPEQLGEGEVALLCQHSGSRGDPLQVPAE